MLTEAERKILKEAAGLVVRETDAGEKVTLQNFGTFTRKTKKARTARNPKTGASVQVPECSVLAFKASSGLKVVKA